MQTEPQEFAPQPFAGPPLVSERKLLAPVWHTIVFVLIVLLNSYSTAVSLPKVAAGASPRGRIFGYVFTIGWELVLLLIVWLGIRSRGVKIKELIGGYAIVEVPSKEEAVRITREFLQLHRDVLGPGYTGDAEIREMMGVTHVVPVTA